MAPIYISVTPSRITVLMMLVGLCAADFLFVAEYSPSVAKENPTLVLWGDTHA